MALSGTTRRPVGRVTQYDPGVFRDEAGNYFTGTKEADLMFAGSDPRIFNIGGQTPAPPGGYGPESYAYREPDLNPEPPVRLPEPPPPPPAPPIAPGPGTVDWTQPFAQVPGFDWTKLTTPSYANAKYTPDVRLFSQALAALGTPQRGQLQSFADWINQHGGQGVTAPGEDLLNFGGGPIDVLTGWGTPWFNNQSGPPPAAAGLTGAGISAAGPGPAAPDAFAEVVPTEGVPVEQAVDFLQREAQRLRGRRLTQEELDAYGRQVGYVPGQPVTGAMINQVLRALGGGSPTTPGPGPGAGPSPPPTTIPAIPLPTPAPQFSDAQTKFLEQFVKGRLQELLGPMTDPALDQYAKLLQERVNTLGTTRPVPPDLAAFQQLLQGRVAALGTPRPVPPDLAAFQDLLRRYGTELQGPAFSPRELDLLQTQQVDPIEQDRQAAKQHAIARMAQRGIGPDSGLYQSALNQVDLAFDALRAQAHGQTALTAIQRGDQRRAQALGVGGQLATLATGLQDLEEQRKGQALGVGGQLATLATGLQDLEEQRKAQALGMGGQLASVATALQDLEDERRREALQTAGGLTGVTGGLRGEEQQRRQEALSLASLLTELPERRLQLVNAIATGSQPPGSLFSALTQLYGIGAQSQLGQQQLGLTRQQNFFSGLGALARLFATMPFGQTPLASRQTAPTMGGLPNVGPQWPF